MTQFISLTLEQSLPESCGECPFIDTEPEGHAYCPSFGEITEWYNVVVNHQNRRGWTSRHPDCKLQTWEAQRVLKFFVEDEHADR